MKTTTFKESSPVPSKHVAQWTPCQQPVRPWCLGHGLRRGSPSCTRLLTLEKPWLPRALFYLLQMCVCRPLVPLDKPSDFFGSFMTAYIFLPKH